MCAPNEKKDKKQKKDKKEKKEKKRQLEDQEESENADTNKKAKVAEPTGWFKENHVRVEGAEYEACSSFDMMGSLGFPKRLVKKCKEEYPGGKPTSIQAACWPLVMEQKDLCAIAKTGSGKTLGFFLPFLALSEKGKLERYEQPCHYPRMVCLAPTHELAMQIQEVADKFGGALSKDGSNKYPAVCIVGGVPKWQQKQQIQQKGCDILVATPGRLQDLANEGTVSLECVQFLVLDEADRMLDQGFVMDVRRIAEMMPKERQTVCFSATWPSSVHRLARELMRSRPVTITVGSSEDQSAANEACQLRANEDVKQIVEVMQTGKGKMDRLVQVLREHKGQRVLIFALYKKEAAWLETFLQRKGIHNARAIQGDMSQEKRTQAITDFKSGAANPLVATDVASRGLDVKGIELVINYTFPLTVEDYVHRVGRTGRGGSKGKAITFFNIDGDHKEKEHAHGLLRVLETSKQVVPAALRELSGNTFCATKKKDHPVYGKFFKDEAEMAKLEAMKVHTTFDSDSD